MTLNDKVQVGDSTTGTSTSTTWRCPYTQSKAEQGWECPRCGRINAPWVRQCDCSRSDKWNITWDKDDCAKPWWYDYKVTCAPETTWRTPSSVCGSDSTTSVKSNPNSTIYTTAANPTVGGSDYWDPNTGTWHNGNASMSNNSKTTTQSSGPSTYTVHNGEIEYNA